MTSRPATPGWIVIDVPPPLTASFNDLLDSAELQHRRDGSLLKIRTRESYSQAQPRLLVIRSVPHTEAGFRQLSTLPDRGVGLSAQDFDPFLAKLRADDALPARVAEFQLTFQSSGLQVLPDRLRGFFTERALPVLPESEFMVVDMASELSQRYTLVRLLHHALIYPQVASADPTKRPGVGLATSAIHGLQPFLSPALAVASPYLFGATAARDHAVGVWLFGAPRPGAEWPSNQLVDALSYGDDRMIGPRQRMGLQQPAATAEQFRSFVSWWIEAVNKLLTVVTDPSRFPQPRSAGPYDPARHWQYLASVERLFRDVGEVMLLTEQHETAQLRAAYDALDTLEGMGIGSFDEALKPSQAQKVLGDLAQALPADVAAVLLPACQLGVDALGRVKDEFVPSQYLGPNGLVGIPTKKGGTIDRSWDTATSRYLRVDRNSAHSYLKLDAEEKATLFSHTGRLPRGLANIALLQLAALLANPQALLRKIPRVGE
ncbi:hypothetical protein ACIHEI_28220 [Kitasatospora sp. NPDC051984]|uniref:hypothetical protein n=1 Tax=Kitasatospora sp. NPDC051984 TaxID=3364059 RepID=UPI0037C73BD4